jgi:hypothetical protein
VPTCLHPSHLAKATPVSGCSTALSDIEVFDRAAGWGRDHLNVELGQRDTTLITDPPLSRVESDFATTHNLSGGTDHRAVSDMSREGQKTKLARSSGTLSCGWNQGARRTNPTPRTL